MRLWTPSPPKRGAVKKLGGRASWRAIAAASHCPIRLGGSLALPVSAALKFFSQLGTLRRGPAVRLFCRWRWEFKSGDEPNGIQEVKTLVCPELQQQDILKSVPEAEG